jgi:hypothetical protein
VHHFGHFDAGTVRGHRAFERPASGYIHAPLFDHTTDLINPDDVSAVLEKRQTVV